VGLGRPWLQLCRLDDRTVGNGSRSGGNNASRLLSYQRYGGRPEEACSVLNGLEQPQQHDEVANPREWLRD
jgi:hypothetical protein